MNINDYVWIKLTSAGRRALRGHFVKYTSDPDARIKSLEDGEDNGYTKMQLWELMNVFGEFTYMTAPQLFEDNEILLEKP